MKNIAKASRISRQICTITFAARFDYQSASVDFLHGKRTKLIRQIAGTTQLSAAGNEVI